MYASARDGWPVDEAHVFRDDACGGAKLNRPALDALRDHAARAAFDLVLVTVLGDRAADLEHELLVRVVAGRRPRSGAS